MSRTTFAAVALAATALVAPRASAAGCPDATSSGHWSTVSWHGILPLSLAVSFGRGGRDTVYGIDDSSGRSILRTIDNGCTWTPALSLDTAGAATDTFRLDPAARFHAVAVAQGTTARSRALYAIASDDGDGLGPSLPIVTFVSTDDGAHWTIHQPSATDLTGDYPRCGHDGFFTTRLRVGSDPSTVYLRCYAGNLAEAFLVPQCREAFYVTHDAARTWTPVDGRLRDVAHATTTTNAGCPVFTDPVPSRLSPRTVWDVSWTNGAVPTQILVSRDEGRTYAPFAHGTALVGCACGYVVREPAAGGRPLLATWDFKTVYVADAAGVLRSVPFPRSRRGTIDSAVGMAPLPDARGRDGLLVAFALKNPAGAEAFWLDPVTRRWSTVEPPMKRPDLTPAWSGVGASDARTAAGVPTVYFITWDYRIVRYVR